MVKSNRTVLIEAIVVGLGLIVLYNIVDIISKYIKMDYGMNVNLFISGFLFHIICEYIGLNIWYAKEYCKLLS